MHKQNLSALKLMITTNGEQSGCLNQNIISLTEEIERLSNKSSLFNQLPFELCRQVATLNILRDINIVKFEISDKELIEGMLSLINKYSFEKLNNFPGSIASFSSSVPKIINSSIDIISKRNLVFNSSIEEKILDNVIDNIHIGGYDEIISYFYDEEDLGNTVDFKEVFPENSSTLGAGKIIFKAEAYLNRKSLELESFKEDLLSFCKKICS